MSALLIADNFDTARPLAHDFSSGSLESGIGVVAVMAVGWVASKDQPLLLVGDESMLSVTDVWNASSRAKFRKRVDTVGKNHGYLADEVERPLHNTPLALRYDDTRDLAVSAGVDDVAYVSEQKSAPRLTIDYCLHVLEVALMIVSEDAGSYVPNCRAPLARAAERALS